MKTFNEKNVKQWMLDNVTDYDNATSLAEAAAHEFNQADTGGPLDDETHWIWDLAIKIWNEENVEE